MTSQEAVFIIPGGNPGKMSYIRDKQCGWYFYSIIFIIQKNFGKIKKIT
jgi:hypothetical protein